MRERDRLRNGVEASHGRNDRTTGGSVRQEHSSGGNELLADRGRVAGVTAGLGAVARTLERFPHSAAVVRLADRHVVWANAFLRAIEGIDEWPDVDLTATAAPSEHDALGERLRDYERNGQPFSVVRSFKVDGEYVQVLMHYWDPFGAEPREYVAFTARATERAASQQLTEWIENWPQAAVVVHREHGVSYANRALRELVGGARCAQDLAGTLIDAVGPEVARRLSELARNESSDSVVCQLACADGTSRRFVVARMAPLAGVDPDVIVLVGHVLADASDRPADLPASLSPRERDIARLLLDGHRVATVAAQLSLSPHTVRNHLRSIFIKTGVKSQSELITMLRAGPSD